MMSETVRIRMSGGNWSTVTLYAHGEFRKSGRIVQGILFLTEHDDWPKFASAKDVHPDDFKCLIDHYGNGEG